MAMSIVSSIFTSALLRIAYHLRNFPLLMVLGIVIAVTMRVWTEDTVMVVQVVSDGSPNINIHEGISCI